MFEQTFVNSQGRTRKPWTVGTSLAIQSILVMAALIAPLMHIAKLEPPPRDVPIFVTLKPLTQIVQPAHAATAALHAARPVFRNPFLAPTRIPPHVDMAPDAPEPLALAWTGASGALSGSPAIPGALDMSNVPAPQKPAPPKPAAPAAPHAPLRVGGTVQAAMLISAPKPVYPQLAKAARVSGTVRLQAIIAVDGTIKDLKLISGPPLLVNAAIDAVKRWQYKPTLLNGSPVEVITDIDVNFTLN